MVDARLSEKAVKRLKEISDQNKWKNSKNEDISMYGYLIDECTVAMKLGALTSEEVGDILGTYLLDHPVVLGNTYQDLVNTISQ